MQSGAPLAPSTAGSASIVPSVAMPATSVPTDGQQPAVTSPALPGQPSAPTQQQPASQQQQQSPAAGTPTGLPNAATSPSVTAPGQRRPHLYVGNLSPSVAEHMLIDIFSTAGPVASVKIIPERNQNQHHGYQGAPNSSPTRYAFVEFRELLSAEKALHTLNGRKLFDLEIRVNWAHQATTTPGPGSNGAAGPGAVGGPNSNMPGSAGSKADEAHVFVGDLAPEINDEALRKAFSAFGSLSEARVMWDMVSGKSRGYGFLTFRTKGDAEQAIATMNGEWLGSRAIRVNWANQKNDPAAGGHGGMGGPGGMGGGHAGGRGGPQHHMHGGAGGPHGFNAGMGGPHMMGMGMPGAPYGMGGPGAASMPPGMPLTYEQTLAASHLHNTTIYVGNLLPFTTQNDLVPYFQNYGYITEVRMQADRGFAFVRLDSHENAAMAISQLNGTPIHNRPIKCGWGKDRHEGGRSGGGGGGAGGAGGAGGYGAGQGAGMGPGGYGNMMYGMQAQYPYSNAFGYPGAQGAGGMGMPGAQGSMGMGMGAGGMNMPGATGLAPPGSATSASGAGGQDGGLGMPIPQQQQGQGQQNGVGSNGILGTSPVGNGAGGVPGSVGSTGTGGLDAAMQQQMAAAFGGAGQGGYGGLNGNGQGGQEYYNSYAQYQALGAGGYGGFGASGQTGNGAGAQGR
ncbi:hypothetical protein A4X13_0g6323 [Tilletia indica]|uniref:RRM domain-containing protein n=1 Tax=Tilletia indica TaxID=43049 RepID=A0A177T5S5_9BASI|nr:hypothetical protein A4X13_0g6323 [Tilletia indica]